MPPREAQDHSRTVGLNLAKIPPPLCDVALLTGTPTDRPTNQPTNQPTKPPTPLASTNIPHVPAHLNPIIPQATSVNMAPSPLAVWMYKLVSELYATQDKTRQHTAHTHVDTQSACWPTRAGHGSIPVPRWREARHQLAHSRVGQSFCSDLLERSGSFSFVLFVLDSVDGGWCRVVVQQLTFLQVQATEEGLRSMPPLHAPPPVCVCVCVCVA